MTFCASFFVAGEPKGQPRPRAFARKINGTFHARVYNPASAEGWKSAIASAAKTHLPEAPLVGPVSVNATFFFPRPKAHYRSGKFSNELKPGAPSYCTTKPDRDNADKALLDTLTQIGFFYDDAQVVKGTITKRFVLPGQTPGCRVEVLTLGDPTQEGEP